ncbi:chorismate-binding protein [Hydrogenophaga pseudoflava]|uniref:chorismate-binding protein n=1 Tax=Hydrogenophaga pseudoflava TaxID=47421 RepID=UPI0027E4E516|nr:chorismate-binding protein [Hydrogenophaga pseudoflava]MDQ7743111.1 chorismate-binding protein [Hydrogenophaga pseudoflava]
MSRRSPLTARLDFPDTAPGAPPGARLRLDFEHPLGVIEAWSPDQVLPAIEQVQAQAAAGRWCVGGLAYEAAPAFDSALPVRPADPHWPLVWFGVYDTPSGAPDDPALAAAPIDWTAEWGRAHYLHQADKAREAMAAGECYQINLTTALRGRLGGDPAGWMAALRRHQGSGYLLRLGDGERQVLSASPELFFDWQPDPQGGRLVCRPMKGTAARESDPALDRAACEALHASPKERAENVMIVDLLRNDLGRLARTGSVRVDRLLEVEAWPTVWQMTSTITARVRPGTTLTEVLTALFPCGSVTGAPKRRAMHHITALEDAPRGFYCGALGVVRPGGHTTFNVPIRTLGLHRSGDEARDDPWHARYGVGSGLTVCADPAAEWRELMTKSRHLHRIGEPFDLLETLRLEHGRYWLLTHHLDRLRESAAHFGHLFDPAAVEHALEAVRLAHPGGLWRVRLLVDATGRADAQAYAMTETASPVRVALAPSPLNTEEALQEFIRHKTTRRGHYEALAPTDPAVFDHLLYNQRGELTEFTRGNVAVRLDDQWWTPSLDCGLLPGTYRRELLAQGRLQEAVIPVQRLAQAQGLAFFNGLRGWLDAALDAAPPPR